MAPFLDAHNCPSAGSVSSFDDLSPTPPAIEINGLRDTDDIAVVGMACRLPGKINSAEDLWTALLNKKVASSTLDPSRWEPYHRRDARNSKILNETTQKGYFLDNVQDFDASFFGISPKEAVLMDPQQRISLEVAWEALEDAGIPPQSLAGSNTACFMGVNSDDYGKLVLEDLPGVEAWMGIGTAYCGVPNRISYLLDLRGPSTAVDAACASSLVAIHHGAQSLKLRESDVAIVGGVNALCGPGLTRVLDKAGAISKDGICKSFDDSANGYGRGEGAAIVVLKRYHDAIRSNDRIYAVLKGSAVGQDGKTNGIMAPNGAAQQVVARKALGTVDPLSIQYVEAHATSTSVGDPVEIGAMSGVYGQGRPADAPCYVGSVKANVGHLEAGAGGVGFMKAVTAMCKGSIPPQANLVTPNTKIDWDTAGLKVSVEQLEWPQVAGKRRAAISSYGYGGTVSHAVIEEGPAMRDRLLVSEGSFPTVFLLTAPQEKRIAIEAASLADFISDAGTRHSASSIGATLATRRGFHDFRAGLIIEDKEQRDTLLRSLATRKGHNQIVSNRANAKDATKVVWLFSGHGAQWPDMGTELLAHEPVFRTAVQDLDTVVAEIAGFSPVKALRTKDFASSDRVQVLTYVVQVGLTALLQSKGSRADAIIGHSVGEIAAAVAAGALSPTKGAVVVCKRAVLYRRLMGQGAMVLVTLSFEEAGKLLRDEKNAYPAIDASPNSCVVSGTIEAIDRFSATCKEQGIKALKVNSDVAFHTPLLASLADPLQKELADIEPCVPTIPLYSTSAVDSRQQIPRDAAYWIYNMMMPVQLTNAVRAAVQDGYRLFLEVSAHPIIANSVNETIMDMDIEDANVFPTMLRNKPVRTTILKGLVSLWSKGANVHWDNFFSGVKWADDVPKTQWQHKPYYQEVGAGTTSKGLFHDVTHHALLGHKINVAGGDQTIFSTQLDNNSKPFPGSHPLHGTEIVPAAVLFNTFLHATSAGHLSDIHLRVPVAISAPRDLQVIFEPGSVKIMSRLVGCAEKDDVNNSWLTHTTATPSAERIFVGEQIDITATQSRIGKELPTNFTVDYLEKVGVPLMGFPWTVTHHVGTTSEMLARVDVCPDISDDAVFPWDANSWAPVFDAATSIGSTLFFNEPRLRMPAFVDRVAIREGAIAPKIAYIHVTLPDQETELACDVTVRDESGKALAKFFCMRFSEIEGTPGAIISSEGLIHQVSWLPASMQDKALPLDKVIILGQASSTLTRKYTKHLTKRGIPSQILAPKHLTPSILEGSTEGTVVVHIPPPVTPAYDITSSANMNCIELLDIVQLVCGVNSPARIYTVTENILKGESKTALAQSPLVGLSRIIASELPKNWGALIDVDSNSFPFQVIKHVIGADVVKVKDAVARVARLTALPKTKSDFDQGLKPRPEGTYLITGGFGSLGLEVASHLIDQGAKRIVLLSRRTLPPRRQWSNIQGDMVQVIDKIKFFEERGACIYTVALDISASGSSRALLDKLDNLNLPPVLGVIHAAGVLEDQFVLNATPEEFKKVITPKIAGAMNLHEAFPPTTIDFFNMFSSCGQLFGFPGQASYASGNAFLDALAEHRRRLGDNAVAIQWTSWRGVGGMGDNEFVEAELDSRGFTSITRTEAFQAWDEISGRDCATATVLRSRVLDADEILPVPILEHIAIRREDPQTSGAAEASSTSANSNGAPSLPPPGPERNVYLTTAIAGCVASVLQLAGADEVDPKAALSDLGMDSVMTVAFRKQLQQNLKVKVPPTLVWGHPTVSHLVRWFGEQLGA
ncbi:polyketide syntase 2 [Eremomyces bilateralis CBS 781.70]|uniref:6-methylsalicylic acid synthase n=1 Tax=Eremomyces bilateralis CBS 781.70 TaxID=1392243 RepID=A0A6G1G485_9PEZI|nr:polyketide syntase 2 [Eremomyces bilateralis CBS 781.70]KAF1812873.1 polyketide syntase 2 [Eremomyces bilateralis CBS 781.70]